MEAKALYDFDTSKPDELGFKKNDILLIMDMPDKENWWPALSYDCPSDVSKVVPRNYIEMLPHKWYKGKLSRREAESRLLNDNQIGNFLLRDSESSPGEFSLSIRFKEEVQHFKILRDGSHKFFLWVVKFPSINKLIEYHKQASVSRTDTIILQEETDEAEQTQSQVKGMRAPAKEVVTCMYEFKPDDVDELPFSKGDKIEVIQKEVVDSWWKGKNLSTGKIGLFPINYVKK